LTNEALTNLAIFLIPVVFAAGGYVAGVRTMRKQINGLGGRVNRIVAALIHVCPEAEREKMMLLILGLKKDTE
jgi:hypothetical protein